MKTPGLSPRDRRALLLGAVVLGPMLLFGLVVRPFAHALSASRARVATQRAALARELAALGSATSSRDVAHRGGALLDTVGKQLLPGDDALAVSAALAAYVRDIAEESGLHLQGTEAAGGELADVRLEIRADGDIGAVYDFLRAIEDGDTLVRVERVGIDRHGPEGGGMERGRLTLSATLRGYARAWYASTSRRGAP